MQNQIREEEMQNQIREEESIAIPQSMCFYAVTSWTKTRWFGTALRSAASSFWGTFSKPVMRVAVFLGVAFAIYDGVQEMVQKQEPGSGEAKPRTSNCLSPPLPEGCDCNWRGGSDRRPLEAVAAPAAVKSNNKALLDLEDKSTPSASSLESKLSFCNGDESFLSRSTKLNPPNKKPVISSFPQSQFLGKVKDFLGVISEANKNLELDAKTNPGKNHDIEALTGEEYEYIEMDLMLSGCAEKESEAEVARRRREGWRGRWS
nr:histone deacetylase HDT2 [Ipomoea batatas]